MSKEARTIVARVADETAAVAALKETLGISGRDLLDGDEADTVAIVIDTETDLKTAVRSALAFMDNDQALVWGLDAMIEKYETRRNRLKARVEFVRAAIEQALEISGQDSLELEAVTLTLSKRKQAVIVTDESALPAKFWKAGKPTLDKEALNRAVAEIKKENEATRDSGGTIKPYPPGVVLSNAPRTITVRRT